VSQVVGPGSKFGEKAFEQTWTGERLWMNAPFSALEKVIEKVINDGAHAILVMPEWCHRKFHKAALAIRLADVLLPRGTKLFSLNGKLFRGTLWRTRILLMCGHNPRRPRVCEVTQILRPT